MGRTSIKNKIILSFLILLLLIIVVVGLVNHLAGDFYLAQAISVAIAMATGIIFGSMFSNSLVSRIRALSDAAGEISRGDLSRDLPVVSRDEFRGLEEVFETMVGQLRGMLEDMRAVAGQIQETNGSLTSRMKDVLLNSQRIDTSARAIAESSEKQTLIVQKISVRVNEALREMEDMVRRTEATTARIRDAREKSESGEANARSLMKHLGEVLDRMAEYTDPITRLSGKVEKIRIVISVMDEIAQKTDLLALNASIEASRAGEAGRGFTLVANEIRSMAENSRASSQEISAIIEGILEDNRAVVEAVAGSRSGVSRGREIIDGIVSAFSGMLSHVQEIFGQVTRIEETASAQMLKLGEVMKHFQELSHLAHENFVSTQKTTLAAGNQKEEARKMAAAVGSLNRLSEKMIESNKRFRLGETP